MDHIYFQPQFGENWFDYGALYAHFVKILQNNSHFIEVGSWKGKSSAFMAVEIANSNKQIKFDCIDTWMGSEEHANNECIQNNTLYELFLSNIEPIKQFINPIRLSSEKASHLYDNESIDIVFIDACHNYECVKDDIHLWLPKVKKGGILSGHDYNSGWPGVVRAVNESLGKDNIQTALFSCWVYEKPKM